MMQNTYNYATILILLAAGTLGFGANRARADQAVVVGVQSYPNLPERANHLQGCLNDAESMAGALRDKCKFKVTLLEDRTAGKKSILDTLAAVKRDIGPKERFVFFFAGHGTNLPKAGLLPSDARDDNGESFLDKQDLYDAVAAIPAASRTVILDSCFSGAMSRGIGSPTAHARYYAPSVHSKGPIQVPASGQDVSPSPDNAASDKVCYWTAAMGNESAIEDVFDGAHHGAFSHYAIPLIVEAIVAHKSWEEIHPKVKSEVSDFLGDRQHPTLSRTFLSRAAFDSSTAPVAAFLGEIGLPVKPAEKRKSLWDVYLGDAADTSHLKLTITPDTSEIEINKKVRIEVTVRQSGYLIVLDRSSDQKLYLAFPDDKRCSVDEAKVDPVKVFDRTIEGDKVGSDRLKAIFFASREQAEAVISLFKGKDADGIPLDAEFNVPANEHGSKRAWVEVAIPEDAVYTSEVSFEFVAPGATSAPLSSSRPLK